MTIANTVSLESVAGDANSVSVVSVGRGPTLRTKYLRAGDGIAIESHGSGSTSGLQVRNTQVPATLAQCGGGGDACHALIARPRVGRSASSKAASIPPSH